jgi:hypothetical protein
MSEHHPSHEELQRELEQVRAASPPVQGAPQQPSVRKALLKGTARPVILWTVLIVMFLVIWQFLGQGR